MRAAEIDRTQAKDKADRELLETIYSALITADPTPLEPHPPPGLIERVDDHITEDRDRFDQIASSLDEIKGKP